MKKLVDLLRFLPDESHQGISDMLESPVGEHSQNDLKAMKMVWDKLSGNLGSTGSGKEGLSRHHRELFQKACQLLNCC